MATALLAGAEKESRAALVYANQRQATKVRVMRCFVCKQIRREHVDNNGPRACDDSQSVAEENSHVSDRLTAASLCYIRFLELG